MLNHVLGPLFWDRQLSPLAKRLWFGALLLSPAALAGAAYLQYQMAAKLAIRLPLNERQLVEKARQHVESRGIAVDGWPATFGSGAGQPWITEYLLDQGDAGKPVISALGILTKATFSQGKRRVDVLISAGGVLLGHRLEPEQEWLTQGAMISPADADRQVERRLAELRLVLPGAVISRISADGEGQSGVRSYRYRVSFANLRRLEGEQEFRFAGGKNTVDILSFSLSSKAQGPATPVLGRVHTVTYRIYFAAIALLAVVRYSQRSRRKEVSHLRMLLVTIVVGALSSWMVLSISSAVLPVGNELGLVIFLFVMMLIMGGLVGIAYAATEGDMREFLPSSLTSVDALLSGRVATRNVARSFLLGVCLMSWTLLFRNSVYWLGHPVRMGWEALDNVLPFAFSQWAAMLLLLDSAISGVIICLMAFLLPVTTFWRFVRNRRIFWMLVPALAVFILSKMMIPEPLRFLPAFAVMVVKAAMLLTAFLAVDVLAGIVFAAGFNFLITFGALSWATNGSVPYLGVAAIALFLSLVAAGVLVYRGRVVVDVDVRPKYARDIAERQQLESEMGAAREAQLRLLPQKLPKLEGIEVAARCQPAQVVAGDFYDFFPLSPTRLGILVTDGGSKGLDTALVIALAKGFVKHRCHAGMTPRELLASLASGLGDHLAQGNLDGLCYGVFDTEKSQFAFARFGESPVLMTDGVEAQVVMERVVAGDRPCWAGTVTLQAGSFLAIYTNGVAQALGEPDELATNRWIRRQFETRRGQGVDSLHQHLWERMLARPLGLGQRTPQDDVTVVLLQAGSAIRQTAQAVA